MSAPLSCKTSTFTKEEILSSQTMGNSNSSASSRRRLRGGDRSKGLLGNSRKRPPNFSLPFRSVCSSLFRSSSSPLPKNKTPPPSSRREFSFRVSRYGNPNTMFLSGVSFQFDVNFKRRCAAVMEAIPVGYTKVFETSSFANVAIRRFKSECELSLLVLHDIVASFVV